MKAVAVIETQFGYDQIFKGLLSSEAYQELIAYQAFNDVVDFINAGEYEIEEGQQYNAILEWGGPYSDIGVEKVVDIFKSKGKDLELPSYQTIEKNIPIYTKYFDFMTKEYPETFMYPGISVEAEYDQKENCVYGTIRQRSPGNFGEDREAYIRIWGHRDIYITKYFDLIVYDKNKKFLENVQQINMEIAKKEISKICKHISDIPDDVKVRINLPRIG